MRPLKVSSVVLVFACCLHAQPPANRLVFDATASYAAPRPVPTQLGSNRAPNGSTITVNSQYLLRDGKPWIPVMGEFHYTRYPETYWEEEILKMKASGIDVISTYIFWIHHEEVEGLFDWSGQRNLREFAELCAKHGMLLYPRIGPWAHGEVRNGGLPDWVLNKSAVRTNDPIYLAEVKQFYIQIGQQLHGLLWKDGGPVIGIQIENEYAANGPGQGREHLAALKSLAIDSGIDVPLYTVTGWDNAVVPEDLFLPIYGGGYPDAPWDESTEVLPPADVYSFHFASRVAANMGTTGDNSTTVIRHDADLRANTPFLTAEVGGGIEDTYHRRPVLATSDVPATIPVMIGSGVNLLGYYMYQGGENPDGRLTTLQESQRTGYPNDLPVKGYDFQGPLGEFGEMHTELRELKLYNYFLEDYGAEIAPARAIEPARKPSGPGDFSILRASVRMKGQSGFLFVSNYIRERELPSRPGVQIEVRVPGKTLLVPARPITIPANSYFYWPINLDLDGVTLRYATAQPILKIHSGGETYAFFKAIPGIAVEFAFLATDLSAINAGRGTLSNTEDTLNVKDVEPGLDTAITIHGNSGLTHIVLLSAEQAGDLWRVNIAGSDQLVLTKAQVYSDGLHIILRQIGKSHFNAAFFPVCKLTVGNTVTKIEEGKRAGLFQYLDLRVPERQVALQLAQTRTMGIAPTPVLGLKALWRHGSVAMAPDDSNFNQAGEWRVVVPQGALDGLSDLYLNVHYQGDEARLLDDRHLLTDNFFNGVDWQIGMKRFLPNSASRSFSLQILPLSQTAPIFFEPGKHPMFGIDGQAGTLNSVEALPEYEVELSRIYVAKGESAPVAAQ
ncbi:MAG: beta-galactosidase [Terracidiphilus sp.]